VGNGLAIKCLRPSSIGSGLASLTGRVGIGNAGTKNFVLAFRLLSFRGPSVQISSEVNGTEHALFEETLSDRAFMGLIGNFYRGIVGIPGNFSPEAKRASGVSE
jgi:hypothetical protein